MTLWLTRPHDDSQPMADRLGAHGIRSLVAPVMEIESLPVAWPQKTPAALLVTSRHAARALEQAPASWRSLPVYCAGSATAHIMANAGFQTIATAGTGVMELLPTLREKHAGTHLFYPSGEDIKLDVAPLLQAHGITVERVIAYRANAVESLPDALITALSRNEIQGVVVASPRAAQLVHALLTAHNAIDGALQLDLYCLSVEIAAEATRLLGGRQVYACSMPSNDAMMELLLKHAIKAP